jgi:hypothetical protein
VKQNPGLLQLRMLSDNQQGTFIEMQLLLLEEPSSFGCKLWEALIGSANLGSQWNSGISSFGEQQQTKGPMPRFAFAHRSGFHSL